MTDFQWGMLTGFIIGAVAVTIGGLLGAKAAIKEYRDSYKK